VQGNFRFPKWYTYILAPSKTIAAFG